jgi:hypothetical protein
MKNHGFPKHWTKSADFSKPWKKAAQNFQASEHPNNTANGRDEARPSTRFGEGHAPS